MRIQDLKTATELKTEIESIESLIASGHLGLVVKAGQQMNLNTNMPATAVVDKLMFEHRKEFLEAIHEAAKVYRDRILAEMEELGIEIEE